MFIGYLKNVGESCFLDNYELFEEFSKATTREKKERIKERIKERRKTEASISTTLSGGKSIFKNNLQKKTLEYILEKTSSVKNQKKAEKLLKNLHDNELIKEINYPDEVDDKFEGEKKQITVNGYERDPSARQDCVDKYGYNCSICNFNFESFYGNIGKQFIHVHHKKPLAEINQEHSIDPIEDLIPVCPNCHAMLHKRKPVYTTVEIKERIKKNKNINHPNKLFS